MLEADIKQALEFHLGSLRSTRRPPLFLEELRISGGAARADLVDIEAMHCYEIKSERDSLKRLVNQGSRYIRVFEKITLVTAEIHVELAMKIIPTWWGVMMISNSSEQPFLEIRKAAANPELVPSQLTKLLTKQECLDFLSGEGLMKGRKSLSSYRLQEFLAETFSLQRIKEAVANALRARAKIPLEATQA